MWVLGLLGGVASGKSSVAQQFARLGARVLDADRVGHQVLELPCIKQRILERWGASVRLPNGRVDRSQVARIVFAPTSEAALERAFLEQLTHPEIRTRLLDELERLRRLGVQAAILDAPLLLEAGWDRLCNRLVFVDAPRQVRLARAVARGWTESQFTAREAAQESLDHKRQRADVVVDNSGSTEQTFAQVERFWHELVG